MSIIISVITFLFPLVFFPAISNPVFSAKNYFLAGAVALLLIFAGVNLIKKDKLKYSIAPLDIFVILFLIANIISWYFLPRGAKARSLIQPMGLGSVISLTFLYFLVGHSKISENIKYIIYSLTASGAVLSILSVILFVLPETYSAGWVRYLNFLTFGNPLILSQFLVLVAIVLIAKVVKEVNSQGGIKQWWMAAAAVILLVGTGVTIYRTIQLKPAFLDWFSSWATTVETFKRRPLFGTGPANFNTAFNRFRPREFNLGDNWNMRFNSAHSWFLQVWSELGIIGLAAVVLLLIRSLKAGKEKQTIRYGLIGLWILLILFPGNLISLFLLFLGLGLIREKRSQKEFNLMIGEKGQNGAPYLTGGILIAAGFFGAYYIYQLFMPEFTFYKAVKAASENKGAETYDLQRKAINQNRFIQSYRISFSQTNLALASNMIRQAQEQNQQLTEEQIGQVQQLTSQAVNEAKAAVALEPQNVSGWENLAQIYRQLINTAENADQWSISAYQQAIGLNSINPRLRVDYGGLLFAFEQYEEAAKQFEIAVNLKNDYANAWYNWAHALRQQNKLQGAVERLQQALNLVDRNSDEYEKVKAELEEWRAELDEEGPSEVEPVEEEGEITRPEPLPSPPIDEPIQLPDDAAPPLEEGTTAPEEEEVTDEEEPEPTETPSPEPTEEEASSPEETE
jgi:Tfp pilus assembly protein PilF